MDGRLHSHWHKTGGGAEVAVLRMQVLWQAWCADFNRMCAAVCCAREEYWLVVVLVVVVLEGQWQPAGLSPRGRGMPVQARGRGIQLGGRCASNGGSRRAGRQVE